MNQLDDDNFLTSDRVLKMCGDISRTTLSRWQADPSVQFPRPVTIRKRNFWRQAEVAAWRRARLMKTEAIAA